MKLLAISIATIMIGLSLTYGCASINAYNGTIKKQNKEIITYIAVPVNITGSY